jgi:hypothetical protein
VTCHAYLLEGLFTQGSRPGRTVGDLFGGILEIDSPDWSNGIRYHVFDARPDARPDTEFERTGIRPTFNLRDSGPCVVKRSPRLYGARSEIWYRKETKWRVDTSVLSLRHTNQAIWTAVWFVFYDTGASVP